MPGRTNYEETPCTKNRDTLEYNASLAKYTVKYASNKAGPSGAGPSDLACSAGASDRDLDGDCASQRRWQGSASHSRRPAPVSLGDRVCTKRQQLDLLYRLH